MSTKLSIELDARKEGTIEAVIRVFAEDQEIPITVTAESKSPESFNPLRCNRNVILLNGPEVME